MELRTRNLILLIDPTSAALAVRRAEEAFPSLASGAASLRFRPPRGRVQELRLGGNGLRLGERPLADLHGRGRLIGLGSRAAGLRLRLELRLYEERPFLLLRLAAANEGAERVLLERFTLLSGALCLGRGGRAGSPPAAGFFKAGWHDWVFAGFRGAGQRDVRSLLTPWSGPMHFDPALPIGLRRGEFYSSGWGVLAGERQAVVAGFATLADQFGHVHARCSPPFLELAAAGDGVPLEPGAELASEWGYLQFIDVPHPEALGEYAATVAREMRPRVPAAAPGLGWTHWYQHFQDISQERFLGSLTELARLRAELPFRTAQLDDGYQHAWGDWLECNPKFPRGLAFLAGEVRARGLEPGLWLAPFVVQPGSRLERGHPEWLLRDRRGLPVGSGYFYSFFGRALDASNPAVAEHLERLGEGLRRLGFGMVKADFCYAGALPGSRFDPRLSRAQALRRGLEALRRGFGEQAFLLGCGCPYGPAVGIVDAMRIGPDTAPSWLPELWSLPWSRPLLRGERSLPSLRNSLRHVLAHGSLHRRWWWNDPDCLLVRDFDTRLGAREARSALGLIGLSGGRVTSSDDPARLTPERRRWISLLTPVLSPGGRALDVLEREMPELYDLPLSAPWGSWHVVLAANWQDRPREKSLRVERLGLPADRPLHVFDFWDRGFSLHEGPVLELGVLEPRASRLLRLCPADGAEPILVGSTLHITQGLEVLALRMEEGAAGTGSRASDAGPPGAVAGPCVRIELRDLGRPMEGELWVACPDGALRKLAVNASGGARLVLPCGDGR